MAASRDDEKIRVSGQDGGPTVDLATQWKETLTG